MFRALPLLGLLIALHGAPAAAQVPCGNRAAMVEKLLNQYNEVPMGHLLGRGGSRLLEVWANCTTGTWTILKTYPSGKSCVMAVGDDWQGVGCKVGQPTKGD